MNGMFRCIQGYRWMSGLYIHTYVEQCSFKCYIQWHIQSLNFNLEVLWSLATRLRNSQNIIFNILNQSFNP